MFGKIFRGKYVVVTRSSYHDVVQANLTLVSDVTKNMNLYLHYPFNRYAYIVVLLILLTE